MSVLKKCPLPNELTIKVSQKQEKMLNYCSGQKLFLNQECENRLLWFLNGRLFSVVSLKVIACSIGHFCCLNQSMTPI